MNNLRNRVQLIGHVGNNPEIKDLAAGKKFARFSVATKESYTNTNGEKVSETQWHNLVAWGTTATYIEKYVFKGQEVAIEGKLTTRNYEDKEGVKRYITEIVVNELIMFGKKS